MKKIPQNVKERPILMNGEMVRAILNGQKVQTRRPVKPQPNADGLSKMINGPWQDDNERDYRCPFGTVGDRLWVREAWYYEEHMHDITDGTPDFPDGRYSHRLIYRASIPDYPVNVGVGQHGWRPSIRMPRWASRITLEVTGARVQRLHDISEEDAVAEGIQKSMGGKWCGKSHKAHGFPRQHNTAKEAFADLWDSIYAKRGLGRDANPWVWAITFRRVE